MSKRKLTIEDVLNLYDEVESSWEGDNALQGVRILQKYTEKVFSGAEHDEIFGPGIQDMIDAGITTEDVRALFLLNWHIWELESFAVFV